MTPAAPSLVARAVGLAIASLDAGLLVYLVVSYRWLAWNVPDAPTPAAILVYALLYGVIALLTMCGVTIALAVGAGIVRQFRPDFARDRGIAGVAAAVLAVTLLVVILDWVRLVRPVAALRDTARVDRLEVFEQLARPHGSDWWLAGLMVDERMSISLHLAVLLAIAYLAEKYALAWLRVRWPIPLVPLALVGWLAWIAVTGEGVQRAFVAARDWRPVAEAQSFPQALAACDAIGSGWSLPRASELQLYVSTQPEVIRGWKGMAWTSAAAECGGTCGVVIELAARKSGVWRRPDAYNRSVSACEIDSRSRGPIDLFTRQLARLCAATPDSPLVHPTSLVLVVHRRGTVAEYGQAATVCVRRGSHQENPGLGGRSYSEQRELATAAEFLASVRERCAAQQGRKDFICFALAGDVPPFEESVTERLYRLACDHELRADACAGYATLMDHRGETERARRYRERPTLPATR